MQEVSFTIRAGQTVGGSSVNPAAVRALPPWQLMGLLPPQAARIDGGEILSRIRICCG